MPQGGEEPDYLARAQLETDPFSFEQVVKEAYLLEHGCQQQQEIASIIGHDKSRISQIFSGRRNLKPASMRDLLEHITSPVHRRRILRAWVLEALDVDIDLRPAGSLTGSDVSEKTLRRIDRQIRQSRLDTAAATALEAAGKTDDVALREQLLDRAYFTQQRLDRPGGAMSVARLIAEGARERGHLRRLAAAEIFRIRILVGLPATRPAELEPLFDRASELLSHEPPPPERPPYAIGEERWVAAYRLGAWLTFLERGVVSPDEEKLRAQLAAVQGSLKAASTYQRRFHAHLTAARLHLALGETFQAQEHVEQALRAGERKNLEAYEMCSLVQGRILAETESPRAAIEYLAAVSRNCALASDFYHQRLAEADIARLESGLMSARIGW